MQKIILLVHRYLGLTLGAILLVVAFSGTAIVFKKPIDRFLNPALLQTAAGAGRAPIDDIIRSAQASVTGKRASQVFLPQTADDVIEVQFQGSDLRAYADPYTGNLLGVRDVKASLMGFLADLHVHLLSGKTGERIMGWTGMGLLLLSAMGAYLWWPKNGRWDQAWAVKWGAAPLRVWMDFHKLVGSLAFVLIALTATTGAALALYDIVTEPVLAALTGEGTRKPAPKSRLHDGGAAAIAPMVAHAATLFPNGKITRIALPGKTDGAVGIRMRLEGEIQSSGRTFLWFDQYDGALLRLDNALQANQAAKIQNWLFPLHTGAYGGLPTQFLQVLVGLSLFLLSFSGVCLWWKRRRARASAKARLRNPA